MTEEQDFSQQLARIQEQIGFLEKKLDQVLEKLEKGGGRPSFGGGGKFGKPFGGNKFGGNKFGGNKFGGGGKFGKPFGNKFGDRGPRHEGQGGGFEGRPERPGRPGGFRKGPHRQGEPRGPHGTRTWRPQNPR